MSTSAGVIRGIATPSVGNIRSPIPGRYVGSCAGKPFRPVLVLPASDNLASFGKKDERNGASHRFKDERNGASPRFRIGRSTGG